MFWDSLPKPTGWVNGFEALYTDDQERALDSIITILKSQTGIEISIVTIDTIYISKDNFEDLTLHIANMWGVGEKIKNKRILIGISRDYRKIIIENGYGIEKLISNNDTKKIIDKYFIIPFRKIRVSLVQSIINM
ncbi:MAG: TPM domain-containing protein [Ignavibacteria bacterium]|nr:TPM domain-containing protein [Ignavibacteria bacterium]